MRGKQAKALSDNNLDDLLLFAETSRHPLRNKVIVLLSAKSGLGAGEIAHLTWAMVTDPSGAIDTVLELPDHAAKKGAAASSHCMMIYARPWRRGDQRPSQTVR
jgi:integrase/recombinase XerD